MNNFIYDIPTKVYFGKGMIEGNLGNELKKYGKNVLLTYGGGSIKKSGLYDRVKSEIESAGLKVFELSGIEPNPRIESVRVGVKICKEEHIDVVLAVGGGSTLDCSKWICAGAKVDFDPWDFFSEKWADLNGALPLITVLTLSATGSEMDAGGVITNLSTNEKQGRIHHDLYPKVSFLDPTITYSVGKFQTAAGSADIFNHIIETYFTREDGMYMLDAFMEGLMRTVVKYAPVAIKEPENYEARANLMWASSWAINGFIGMDKRKAWSCHPLEHELSAFYDITHGLGLAIITPRWLRYCLNKDTLKKYVTYGVNVFGIDPSLPPERIADLAIEKTSEFLTKTLGLPGSLSEIGIGEENFKVMAKKACEGDVIDGFVPLRAEDIVKIYKMCE